MNESPKQEDVEKLYKLIGEMQYAMLVTQTSNGSLRSRPMAVYQQEGDQNLWFLTDKDSAKVIELTSAKQVNVSFADSDDRIFVSVSGLASVVDDQAMLKKLWNPEAQIWFPEGTNDPRVTLLKVEPTYAEFWDAPQGIYVELYQLTRSILGGDRPEDRSTDNKKIDL